MYNIDLARSPLERSFLRDDPTLAGLRVEAVNDLGLVFDPSVLRYSTPHRFKGLEADVVLLCDVDGNPMSCAPRNLYVAASRAKNRLYVFQTGRYGMDSRSEPHFDSRDHAMRRVVALVTLAKTSGNLPPA